MVAEFESAAVRWAQDRAPADAGSAGAVPLAISDAVRAFKARLEMEGSQPMADERTRPPAGEPGAFPFTREMATFEAQLPTLLEREGEFVVIRGEEVAGIRETLESALWLAYDRFGLDGFMVKQILEVEPLYAFPHELSA